MRKAIVVLLGALSLVACSKDRPPAESATTTTGSGQGETTAVSVEEVRAALLEKKPSAADTINALTITNDNGIITLRGKVEDEATHNELVNRVRTMPNVRGVRDEIVVQPKTSMTGHGEKVGTTTTTGAEGQGAHGTMGQGTTGEGHAAPGTMGQGTTGEGHAAPGTMGAGASKSDAVRHSMEKARPKAEGLIRSLNITDDGTTVTVAGVVPDAATHQALIKAARETHGVKNVRDELKVEKEKEKEKKKY